MEALFTSEYRWLWTVVLGAMLFMPVRKLIWVMSVRRHERRTGKDSDEETRSEEPPSPKFARPKIGEVHLPAPRRC